MVSFEDRELKVAKFKYEAAQTRLNFANSSSEVDAAIYELHAAELNMKAIIIHRKGDK